MFLYHQQLGTLFQNAISSTRMKVYLLLLVQKGLCLLQSFFSLYWMRQSQPMLVNLVLLLLTGTALLSGLLYQNVSPLLPLNPYVNWLELIPIMHGNTLS